MIIWSIQYFGVQARRAAWQPKVIFESHEIAPKCPKFAASDLFPRACTYYRTKFWSRMKSHQNVPNFPPVIFLTRMYVWISMAVFTTFAATLARQPAAASLAPRLNKIQHPKIVKNNNFRPSRFSKNWFHGKSEWRKNLEISTLWSGNTE